jgi:hypothetical protein
LARVQKTLISDRAAIHFGKPSGARLYIVDFSAGDLAFYHDALDQLELAVETSTGVVSAEALSWNPHTRGVRARIFSQIEIGQATKRQRDTASARQAHERDMARLLAASSGAGAGTCLRHGRSMSSASLRGIT